MNNFFLTLSATFAIGFAHAQITIDADDFPSRGDTALVSISDSFEADFAATGADFYWDFSDLNRIDQAIDTFFDISEASVSYQFVFNNVWLEPDYASEYYTSLADFAIPATDFIPVTIENPVGFTKVEDDFLANVGIGAEIEGFELPVKSEIVDVVYEFPLNFGDINVSNSLLEIDLNPAFDGILKRYQTRTTTVDGYGEIATNFGTFEVVRVKAELEFTDSLRLNFGGEPTWLPLPTPNQVVYTWLAKDQKVPILEVIAQQADGEEVVNSVRYKDSYYGFTNVLTTQQEKVVLFPNPATAQITIQALSNYNRVTIYNLAGAPVLTQQLTNQTAEITLDGIAAGLYAVVFSGDGETQVKQLIIQ